MKPSKGLLTGSHQIFTVKILPKEVRTYKEILKLRLNDNEKNTQDIMALGSAEMAQVLLENKGVMYFKPTCVGTASLQQYAVKNVSRIPLSFEWMLRCEDAKVLTVLPRTGIIQPNESQVSYWDISLPGTRRDTYNLISLQLLSQFNPFLTGSLFDMCHLILGYCGKLLYIQT